MPINHGKVVLFPGWERTLEKESLVDLQEKRYEEALGKINTLLDFQADNHEVFIGKLMCLTALGRYDDAIDLSEELLIKDSEHYYDYAQIYLTVLFQTSQYTALMNRVIFELEDLTIPPEIAEQFRQLYDLSESLNEEHLNQQASVYMDELTKAVDEGDFERQWQLVENLRRMKNEPTSVIIGYLKETFIHPVVKTSILKWLRDMDVPYEVEVHKLDASQFIKPKEVTNIRESVMMRETMLFLNDLEQGNPSLYILLEQLLYRYVYVKFPMELASNDLPSLAEALRQIGAEYLHQSLDGELCNNVGIYVEDIKMCEALYLSIISE